MTCLKFISLSHYKLNVKRICIIFITKYFVLINRGKVRRSRIYYEAYYELLYVMPVQARYLTGLVTNTGLLAFLKIQICYCTLCTDFGTFNRSALVIEVWTIYRF